MLSEEMLHQHHIYEDEQEVQQRQRAEREKKVGQKKRQQQRQAPGEFEMAVLSGSAASRDGAPQKEQKLDE